MVIKKVDVAQRDEQLLVNEVRALSSVNHFNVIGVHDQYLKGKTLWIVMDTMDVSASEVVQVNRLSEIHVAVLQREVCRGLEFLHRKGIIHRDVRCSHLLLNTLGHVKLGE